MQCRSHAAQLGRQYQDIKDAHSDVLIILGGSIERARKYAETLHLPYPVLADPERKIYHLYGLQKSWVFMQRTASIIVDKDGIIRYLRTATNPMTWLQEHHELIKAVKNLDRS